MKQVLMPDFMWESLLKILDERSAVSDRHGRSIEDEVRDEIRSQTA